MTFCVEGRPPRKRQGTKYIKKNQREQERVEAAAMARLVERGDHRAWPKNGPFAVRLVAIYPDRNHADLDNVFKSVKDGLTDVVWGDDKSVLRYREPVAIRFSDHIGEGATLVRVEVVGNG